jgi:hypothetical protein
MDVGNMGMFFLIGTRDIGATGMKIEIEISII